MNCRLARSALDERQCAAACCGQLDSVKLHYTAKWRAFYVTTQTNTTNAFAAGGLRADVLRNPNLDTGQRSVAKWFDTSAFAQPAAYTFGNQGVGMLRGAGVTSTDFSLQREFRFSERIKAQLRGETFNILNHMNLALPGAASVARDLG